MQKFPKKTKFNRSHKIKTYKGLKAKTLSFFRSGLKSKSRFYITWNNFESFRKVYVRAFRSKQIKNKKNFKLIQSSRKKKVKKSFNTKRKINSLIFKGHFFSPLTKKPLQVRMGKGKGSVSDWIFPCSYKRVLFEQLTTIRRNKIKRVFNKALKKMPSNFSFIFDKRKQIFPFRLKNIFFNRRNYLGFNKNEIVCNNYVNLTKIKKKNES